mmetsp:Transcript_12370/g.17641  ORF Transcript_12370/g.17641 Transcript_12370/m.17641 type:complete len:324 (+) Transcript_12370:261-1232(+)
MSHILLLPCREIRVVLANHRFEHPGSDDVGAAPDKNVCISIHVSFCIASLLLLLLLLLRFLFPLFPFFASSTVFVCQQSNCYFRHLYVEVTSRVGRGVLEDRLVRVPLRELWEREKNLQHRVHVARVADVDQPDKARPTQRRQISPRFLDSVELEFEGHVHLHLRQSFVCLLHLHDVYPPPSQVLRQHRVGYHVVLISGITADISAFWRDSPQFDHKRVVLTLRQELFVVVESAVLPARSVQLCPSIPDKPVRQVQPQVLSSSCGLALPISRVGGYFLAVVLKREIKTVAADFTRDIKGEFAFLLGSVLCGDDLLQHLNHFLR